MIDDPSDTPPGDDFRPEDLLPPEHGGPTVSADFVARTFAKVRDDQLRIREEASRVAEIRLPRSLLDAYTVPSVAPGFVDATLARVRAERRLDDEAVHALLAAHEPPTVSPDFVERTLDALRVETSSGGRLRALRPAAPPSRAARRWRRTAAAAAVLVAVAYAVSGRGEQATGPERPLDATPAVASSQEFTPAVLGTALSRWTEAADGALRVEPLDGLLFLASAGPGRSE